ncbi:MAG TPA: EcsC family protein [Clostridium sp.]|nr:hypothetical protein A7W90_08890 [Clostridium sp. Bc-iso-3]HHV30383.1 EcsC family protein [Clostridium sp.]
MEKKIRNPAFGIYDKSKDALLNLKDSVVGKLDQNGDGEIGIDDIIILAMKTPGVHISRASFLQKELSKNHTQEVIDNAIAYTPAHAGISVEEIDKIADEVIKFERNCVSGISTALGAPGGWAMAATIPADIVQYYGYTLRAMQKLLYLYGFPEIESDENGLQLDSETLNTIILCLGVMNGVAGANNAVKAMAKALAIGVEKKLMKAALTKGAIYPFVKNILKWFGVRLTKSVFSGAIKKAIPVIGGVVGGGITFFAFKPCCSRLKNTLRDTMLSNPNHISSAEEDKFLNCIISGEIIEPDCEVCESSVDDSQADIDENN